MRISDWSSDVCSSDLALPRLLVRRCIAAAAFDADAEFHFGDRAEEVALDVGREGFQRRNIERVEPVRRVLREIDEARQKPRQGLARPRSRDEQGMFAALARAKHVGPMPTHPPPEIGKAEGRGRVVQYGLITGVAR